MKKQRAPNITEAAIRAMMQPSTEANRFDLALAPIPNEKLREHLEQLKVIRLTVYVNGRRHLVTPAVLDGFCAMIRAGRLMYQRIQVLFRADENSSWLPSAPKSEELDHYIRQRLPKHSQQER